MCANYERDQYQDLENKKEIDLIVEAVRNDLLKRSQVGIKKYNTTLDNAELSLLDYLQHAYEECLDQANYLKGAILEIKNKEDKKNGTQ